MVKVFLSKTMHEIDWSFSGVCKSLAYLLALLVYAWTEALHYTGIKQGVVVALAIAMVFDTITGVYKAHKLKLPITSRAGKHGIMEKILLLLGLLVTAVIGKSLDFDLSWLISNAFVVLTLFEVYSFFGNLSSAKSGKNVQEIDAVSVVIRYIRGSLRNIVDKILKYNENESQSNS